MAGEADNLVVEILRKLQQEFSLMRDDIRGIRVEMTGIKQHIAAFMTHEMAQDTEMISIRQRLERIERRLDLID